MYYIRVTGPPRSPGPGARPGLISPGTPSRRGSGASNQGSGCRFRCIPGACLTFARPGRAWPGHRGRCRSAASPASDRTVPGTPTPGERPRSYSVRYGQWQASVELSSETPLVLNEGAPVAPECHDEGPRYP
eukprot:768133-Hanusia_phi.AAC.2